MLFLNLQSLPFMLKLPNSCHTVIQNFGGIGFFLIEIVNVTSCNIFIWSCWPLLRLIDFSAILPNLPDYRLARKEKICYSSFPNKSSNMKRKRKVDPSQTLQSIPYHFISDPLWKCCRERGFSSGNNLAL